ncbi:hypothetical protein OG799_11255 [Micromonospora sp. NBC_00898]|uniref:hypothetical protein n=1 Tax=Micromonospora sp. NBC_00898 TaxID=2975981 RepID=UPI0038630EA2|nr:hypothetical protein OG799_11255 [Micromonospora sp. NBC_00898]
MFARNDAARRFYAAQGWTPDTGTQVEEAYGEPEVRLRRKLPAVTPAPARRRRPPRQPRSSRRTPSGEVDVLFDKMR